MDEPSGGFSVAGEWTTRAGPRGRRLGERQVVELRRRRELRNILGQLIAAELLQMSLAELLIGQRRADAARTTSG